MTHVVPAIIYFGMVLLIAILAARFLAKRTGRAPEKVDRSLFSRPLFKSSARALQQSKAAEKTGGSWNDRMRKAIPVLLCLGLILMPYFENRILQAVAYALIILPTLAAIGLGEVRAGPKWVWIPLLVITVSGLVFSGLPYESPTGLLLVWMLGVYLVSNRLGAQITRYFGLATFIGCISIIVYSATHGFAHTGGLFSHTNYNMGTAAVLAGFLLWESDHKWLLSPLVLVSLFFTGADEAILTVAILFAVILIRKDWSRKMFLPVGALILTLVIATPLGVTQTIWGHVTTRVEAQANMAEDYTNSTGTPAQSTVNTATGYRWDIYVTAVKNLSFIGHGYNPFDDSFTTIHDVPLRVAYELGIVAGIAWLVTYFYALRKSKAKYALVAIGALSLADHMFWTQIPAYYWAALGLGLSSTSPDLLFRRVKVSLNKAGINKPMPKSRPL